jgi:8-oxo-dGTP pyrophosphatase MutT (NUDIX family)
MVAPMAPTPPRPAASLILLRRGRTHGNRRLEVLLVRRSPEASFMPGVWVFPGGTVDAGDMGNTEAAHRSCAVRELREEAGIELHTEAELVPWSRWITPEAVPVRFDTRFYLALAPPHSPPRPDGAETTDAEWISPEAALARHRRGALMLVFPTIKHLESLLPYSGAEDALAAARHRTIEPVLPRVVGEGSERRILLPWEPGY